MEKNLIKRLVAGSLLIGSSFVNIDSDISLYSNPTIIEGSIKKTIPKPEIIIFDNKINLKPKQN